MNAKETYNKIAEDWQKDHFLDDWWKETTEKYCKMFKPGSLILDVGCGPGHISRFIYDHGLNVFGIDDSEKMIELANKAAPKCEFEVLDMRDVDKLDKKFDGIFAQASLLHIPKKEAHTTINKLYDRLKPGGYFHISVKESWSGIDEETKTENDYGYEYKRFFSYYTEDEIRKYFTDLGMKIVLVNKKQHNKTIWIQVIAKK
jgi:2-polyprenyl-3-methyl-5-hydroxy-6-metoxy-1,4-benzoquinol methylase